MIIHFNFFISLFFLFYTVKSQTLLLGKTNLIVFIIDIGKQPIIVEAERQGYFPFYEILLSANDTSHLIENCIEIAKGKNGLLYEQYGKYYYKNDSLEIVVRLKPKSNEKLNGLRHKIFIDWVYVESRKKLKSSPELKKSIINHEIIKEDFLLFKQGKIIPSDSYIDSYFNRWKNNLK